MQSKQIYRVLLALLLVLTFSKGIVYGETGNVVGSVRGEEGHVRIYVASSLRVVMEIVSQDIESEVSHAYASSSLLAMQIAQGAPADIYISANPLWMEYLEEGNYLVSGSVRNILSNYLILAGSDVETQEYLGIFGKDRKITSILGGTERLVIGDPRYVPVGNYTKELLENIGQWVELQGRLIHTENALASLAILESRTTGIGIIYNTDLSYSSGIVKKIGDFPMEFQPRITYTIGIVRGSDSKKVRRIYEHLTGAEARRIYTEHDFIILKDER